MSNRIRARHNSRDVSIRGNTNTDSGANHASAGGGKRKRDVLQDISEEHSCNGGSTRQQQQQASASASRRSQQAPRRPSPMAPARRSSVRRSRRLSEQQPSAAGGRVGGRAAGTAAAGASGGGGGNGRGDSEAEADEDGGMSCDEDLEGMVVDLSFDGVADDSGWRETGSSGSSRQAAAASSGGVGGGSGGRGRGRSDEGAGGKGASTEGGGGSEAESGSSTSSTTSEVTSASGVETNLRGTTTRLRDRSCAPRDRDDGHLTGSGSVTGRKAGSETGDDRTALLGAADASRGACGRRESLESEAEVNFSSSASGGHSVVPQPSHTPLAARAPAAREVERRVSAAATASVASVGVRTPLPAGVEDIDAGVEEEAESHLLNPDYVVEHAAFLRVQEKRNRPAAYIGERQKDMRQSMRSVLVDWIVEVCDQFKLSSRTLFQVVDLIDRSLSAFEVPRGRLQLLGCACVVVASKYEEIYAPTAEELAHISDNTYTRAEIISMELVVVNALQFRLTCITPRNFVDRFCRAARSNARERSLVAYLLELLLQDYQGVTLLPSLKAAAALYLARQTLHPRGCPREAWTKQTEFYTGYCARALEPCVRRLHTLHLRAEANNLRAVRDKYKKMAMHRVAEVTCALEEALYFGDEA